MRGYKMPDGALVSADLFKRLLSFATVEKVETNTSPGSNVVMAHLTLESPVGQARLSLLIPTDSVVVMCGDKAAHVLGLREAVTVEFESEDEKLALDTDLSNVHRAIHRVVRAMNDGECPKCHVLDPRNIRNMALEEEMAGVREVGPGWGCSYCGFFITDEQGQAAMKLFAPKMEGALAIFEEWRAGL